ncbi:ubiquitin-conjugating enzyme/RWD-like protein [Roridomyces roridus]|uniref:Ubiquitin-conjugating enzyme/RWD-like protein n=1 Tax=Roridomyces roridus TaxID=1738132 RepID=A0AAD7BWK2_9AGAR|nr:ubiquitin-conjugating enzyme/RWD-like protein [Roridomyces roridus]
MSSDVLLEEFEVLESIYPSELTKISDTIIQIDVEPDDYDPDSGSEQLKLTLEVQYPPEYPDVLPDLLLHPIEGEGEIDDSEIDGLLSGLREVGEENIGIAMTFTLVSHLREQLSTLVRTREEVRQKAEMEKERLAIEAEEARTRGTAVTQESFRAWKVKFDQEMSVTNKAREEEKLRALTAKEREEMKRVVGRLSGRQLFERNRNLEEDTLLEEGAVSVDLSQYDRTSRDAEEEEEGLTFSDSD